MWDSFQTLAIVVENFLFLYFWNPNWVRKNMPTYAGPDLCMQVKGHFGHFISKNRFLLI